ncbi:UDP-glucose/GDP-mannose dehydrogenase family protein [Microbaculum marinum]|uniref:UDP-glucose 6-dehydrogenase n=1 Tax=Microbaculum marinum TaxID=1764581 RepID=A0AAW9RQC9_9HYPH
MKLAVVGAGYVGLTTSACLAELGHSVTCVDSDASRIAILQGGGVPIYEEGLHELMQKNRAAGRLTFSADLRPAAGHADAIFLAVGTPSRPDGDIDLSHIETAARQLARDIRHDAVLIIKSTVVAGTARNLGRLVARERGGDAVSVASNPEFLREGTAIADFMTADRIVAGADDDLGADRLRRIYAPLRARDIPYLEMSTADAEMVKYAANAFLALKLGFINNVADLCESTGGDIRNVVSGIGLDRRIGPSFLSPGPGYGGSCFPKDTRAFAALGKRAGARQWLVERLIEDNEARKRKLAQRIIDDMGKGGRPRRVAVLGLAFKSGTDDVRESAALTIIPLLQASGAIVHAHDPRASRAAAEFLPGVRFSDDCYHACGDVDAAVVLTEWDEYRHLDLRRLASVMRGRLLFDFRNILDPAEVSRHGFRYRPIGHSTGPFGKTAEGQGVADIYGRAAAYPV